MHVCILYYRWQEFRPWLILTQDSRLVFLNFRAIPLNWNWSITKHLSVCYSVFTSVFTSVCFFFLFESNVSEKKSFVKLLTYIFIAICFYIFRENLKRKRLNTVITVFRKDNERVSFNSRTNYTRSKTKNHMSCLLIWCRKHKEVEDPHFAKTS